MIKVALNTSKQNNYAFFCPISRLHLTRSNPVGFVKEVTRYILRGLNAKVLIDVDNVIDLETGKEKVVKTKQVPENPQPTTPEQSELTPKPDPVENTEQSNEEINSISEQIPLPVDNIPTETTKTTKKGGRKKVSANA